MHHASQITRRGLLFGVGGALLANDPVRPRVAAIVTEFRHRSHADVICTRILDGYYPNGKHQEPRTALAAMYTDQVPPDDMSRGLQYRGRVKIYPTISEALMRGGNQLAVEAVLLIGEHGDYPENSRGQKMYPRYELMEKIVEVFRKAGRSVPLFCDKHLSYSWDKAKKMYDWSQELKIPFMAGSSIPVTVRVPELEIPYNAKITKAVQIGYGPLDAYGFHTLEAMQCMIERRAGGETGVASVEMIGGDAVWRWRDSDAGKWSKPLFDKAMASNPHQPNPPIEENCKKPAAFVMKYRDGLNAVAYMLDSYVDSWDFAAEVDGRVVATHFGQIPETRDLPHFDGLTDCIEQFFVSGKPLYPVERTLLTTGILAFAFESREKKSRVDTPQLSVSYRAPEHTYFQRS